jgi:hypothetical protein
MRAARDCDYRAGMTSFGVVKTKKIILLILSKISLDSGYSGQYFPIRSQSLPFLRNPLFKFILIKKILRSE